jgi:hypothetical protein
VPLLFDEEGSREAPALFVFPSFDEEGWREAPASLFSPPSMRRGGAKRRGGEISASIGLRVAPAVDLV